MKEAIKGFVASFVSISLLIILNIVAVNVNGIDFRDLGSEIVGKNIASVLSNDSESKIKEVPLKINSNIIFTRPSITPIKENVITGINTNTANKEYIKKRICEVFGTECQNALIIAYHESKYNPNALSKTGDYGVMQVNCYYHSKKVGGDCNKLYNLEINLQVALQIFKNRGWDAWATKHYLN